MFTTIRTAVTTTALELLDAFEEGRAEDIVLPYEVGVFDERLVCVQRGVSLECELLLFKDNLSAAGWTVSHLYHRLRLR